MHLEDAESPATSSLSKRFASGCRRPESRRTISWSGTATATKWSTLDSTCRRAETSDEMEHAGFHVSTGGNRVQCFGTDQVDYEQELVTHGSVGSRLSKILTQRCNVLINVPVLKDHDGAGVTIALKNMYGVIHNPNKYHPNGCNPYIADLNMLPEIRTRMRLTICDATTASY